MFTGGFLTGDRNHAPDYVKNGNFVLNKDSLQAQGLVGWWPILGQSRNAIKSRSLFGGHKLTLSANVAKAVMPFGAKALDFLATDETAISDDGAVLSAYPLTLTGWGMPSDTTTDHVVISIQDSTAPNEIMVSLQLRGDQGGDPARLLHLVGGDFKQASTSNGYSSSKPNFVFGAMNALGHKRIILNGDISNGSSETSTVTAPTVNRTSIGFDGDSTPGGYFDGLVWDVRAYNRELPDAMAPEMQYHPWDLFYEPGRVSYFFVPAAVSSPSPLGVTTEVDAALAIIADRAHALGIAPETDIARAMTALKTFVIGLSSEVDVAQAMVRSRTYALGLIAETDAALSIIGDRAYALGTATETDAALAMAALKARTISLSSVNEIDIARAMIESRIYALSTATETDVAPAITPLQAGIFAIGVALEVDTALAIAPDRTYALGVTSEVDLTLAMTILRSLAFGVASEVDAVLAMTHSKALLLSIAAEIDTAPPMTVDGGASVGATSVGRSARMLTAQRMMNIERSTS